MSFTRRTPQGNIETTYQDAIESAELRSHKGREIGKFATTGMVGTEEPARSWDFSLRFAPFPSVN